MGEIWEGWMGKDERERDVGGEKGGKGGIEGRKMIGRKGEAVREGREEEREREE